MCLPCLPCVLPCCAAGWCGYKTSKLVEPKKPSEPVESALATELKLRVGVRRGGRAGWAATLVGQRAGEGFVLQPALRPAWGVWRQERRLLSLGTDPLLGLAKTWPALCPLPSGLQLHKAKGSSVKEDKSAPSAPTKPSGPSAGGPK